MKTYTFSLQNVKSSDTWFEMVHELCYDKFLAENNERLTNEIKEEFPHIEDYEIDDLITDEFYDSYPCGDYANLEITCDENLKIVGGKINLV